MVRVTGLGAGAPETQVNWGLEVQFLTSNWPKALGRTTLGLPFWGRDLQSHRWPEIKPGNIMHDT